VSSAKSTFLTNFVLENSSNPRSLWQALHKILHKGRDTALPNNISVSSLPDIFLTYFSDKIAKIREKFSSTVKTGFSLPHSPPPVFSSFKVITLSELHKLIFSSPSTHCSLDILPNHILKECFDVLGPVILNLINLSLTEGCFPSSFANAVVHPLIKKSSLCPNDLTNYRPISNLNFLSKILERVVANQIHAHLSANDLFLHFQSAYRKYHSTETALLAVHDHIISAMENGKVTALILLDLSAAFDTVDHSILLHRLQHWFGLSDSALHWFTTYLNPRTQSVCTNGTFSASTFLNCGVPQGSVLGPLLFTLYTTPLGSLLSDHNLDYHLYADDTQILISFDNSSSESSLEILSRAFSQIQSWMDSNKLLLNPTKTEFLLFGTKPQLKKFDSINAIKLGDSTIPVSTSARDLGVIFDSTLSFTNHTNSICKAAHYHLRDLYRIRKFLNKPALMLLANALVSSRLDYCNSLLLGISKSNLAKLQRVQNSLARVVSKTPKRDHITPVRKSLHWLPIKERIDFKICLLVYKTMYYKEPSYLFSKLSIQANKYSTRSSSAIVLSLSHTRTVLGTRAFSVAAPKLWNSLPQHVRIADSLQLFKTRLKTHLFDLAYPP
jgi:hypothetical protein